MNDNKFIKRGLFISSIYLILVLFMIGWWIYGSIETEILTNRTYQYTWLISLPLAFFLILFPAYVFVSCFFNSFCPIKILKRNSKYYAYNKPTEVKVTTFPSVTLLLPVYKEDLGTVISKTLNSLILCRDNYNNGVKNNVNYPIKTNIIVFDDGLQVITELKAQDRINFYKDNNIAYIARPVENRHGQFKKASNLNFGMAISQLYSQLSNRESNPNGRAIHEEINSALNYVKCPIQSYGNLEIGDLILLVDADSTIPVDCLETTIFEFIKNPKLAVTQHLTYPSRITRTFWESFIAHFTELIYNYSIRMSCASGNISPFVGHNAMLRKEAMYNENSNSDIININEIDEEVITDNEEIFLNNNSDQGDEHYYTSKEIELINEFRDCNYKFAKIWSEKHVSEDFEICLKMLNKGYYAKYITYTGDNFTEGVSLSYDDELGKFKKYTYGSFEIMFNSIADWICCRTCKPGYGCFSNTIIDYLKSKADFSSKLNLLSYLFSYFAMASGFVLNYINYFLYGWFPELVEDMWPPMNIIIQIAILFGPLGVLSHSIVMGRFGEGYTFNNFIRDLYYTPFYFLFFGSIQYHLFKTILISMFCKNNLSWASTNKEISNKSRLNALNNTFKIYVDNYIIQFLTIIMMIVLALPIIPEEWRITNLMGIIPMIIASFVHIFGPILLNPNIISRRIYQ